MLLRRARTTMTIAWLVQTAGCRGARSVPARPTRASLSLILLLLGTGLGLSSVSPWTSRTGLSQQDAEKRVNDTYARAQANLKEAETDAKAAADSARKAPAYGSLWLFISLLIGAFTASLAATYGGRQRDL